MSDLDLLREEYEIRHDIEVADAIIPALEAEVKFLTQSLDDRMDLYAGAEARARKAEAAVEFKDQALDGMHAQLREAEAEARKYKRLCDERADDP